MIECLSNGKKYIGASVRIKYRLNQHKSQLIRGVHKNLELQTDFNKFGFEQFEFKVLEYCKYKLWIKERIHNTNVPKAKRYSQLDRNRKIKSKR